MKHDCESRAAQWRKMTRDAVRNGDPIPLTGRKRYKLWRNFRIAQELRYSFQTSEDKAHNWKIRGRRSKTYLPNSWDDYEKVRHRNWKAYRKQQWKAK